MENQETSHMTLLFVDDALWAASTGSSIDSSPAVANGVVYVGSGGGLEGGKLYAFAASSGKTLWTASTDGGTISSTVSGIQPSLAVANGVIYVGSEDGKLYAFHLPGTTP